MMPTFFTGHMSGINWWPAWALSRPGRPDGHAAHRRRRVYHAPGTRPLRRPLHARRRDAPGRRRLRALRDASRHLLVELLQRARPVLHAQGVHRSARPGTRRWPPRCAATRRARSARGCTCPPSRLQRLPARSAGPDQRLSLHARLQHLLPGNRAGRSASTATLCPLACLVTEALGGKRVLFEEFGYASSEHGDISEHKTVRRGPVEAQQYFADDAAGGRYYARCWRSWRAVARWAPSAGCSPTTTPRCGTSRRTIPRARALLRPDALRWHVKPSGEAMRALRRARRARATTAAHGRPAAARSQRVVHGPQRQLRPALPRMARTPVGRYVLGVDAGNSKTIALVAAARRRRSRRGARRLW